MTKSFTNPVLKTAQCRVSLQMLGSDSISRCLIMAILKVLYIQAENISFDIDTDENMYKMGEKIQATLII